MEHGGDGDSDDDDDDELSVDKKTVKAAKSEAGEAKASCPICFKTFRRFFNMKTHVNRVISFSML